MNTAFIRAALRRFPPVARRDKVIARLRRKVRDLRATTAALEGDRAAHAERSRDAFARIPSFQMRIHMERRLETLAKEVGAPSTSVIRHGKFYVYELVRSHGIETPAELGRWDDPADIPWTELPDMVVVKSAFGTNARGTWPLRRSDDGWRPVGDRKSVTQDEIMSSMTRLIERGTIQGPFVAEEFLDEDGAGRLPTDVKIYAFYGEVPMVVLRRPGRLGEHVARTLFRAVDEHGEDTVGLETGSTIDPSLPVPPRLAEAVDHAKRLSLALRTPFSRLDFYCLPDRVVFGEITPRPGGSAWHGPVVDFMLGEAWDRAQMRLARDLSEGMPPEPEFGAHPPVT
ncbi:MAG: ATP-grasp fold amidoligase family protein [Aeromicrobium sp.]